MMTFEQFMEHYKQEIEHCMAQAIVATDSEQKLEQSMIYSLEAGGKRIRPLLVLATLVAFGSKPELGYQTAAAMEMIHTYSLIHDDLPAMDNDDYRRGKLTNHKVYGDATAILAGDALLTKAFELIVMDDKLAATVKVELIQLFAKSAGADGMVGGQQADILGENQTLTLEELESIHRRKTGALLTASVLSGAMIAGASKQEQDILREFSHHIGIAFQICDDILDVIGDSEKMGKKTGSDIDLQKSTYPALLSLEGAKKALAEHTEKAEQALASLDIDATYLLGLTELIAVREF
ncbi:polyprenyl synthetase family protein [Listeria booriae]|uniref:polyprenyl synthetase family protein n=1 Tax=Listeria booriae TaxID=1552123 RepID=UPI0016267B1E|nr:farnesyl diphosphate synthase [Listeria booriae]MBC1511845.1 polyprenyl synthetase family protein [Listeria booriae]MBC6150252.1 polyprenyl synthetase family protein [Listeria booriae]MBC6304891.1 polyprenyl synthetase family protein [Listeria booriae]